jgi:predicted nucleotidyltransferase
MNLADPTGAITPTLDGPVLAALASAGRPLTVGEVAHHTTRGSEIGVRRCLARLVEQGIVESTQLGRTQAYALNRDHIAAPIAEALAGIRLELWKRLKNTLSRWKVSPMYACVFGSAARADGGIGSDIDVLLVHPPFPGEDEPHRFKNLKGFVGASVLEFGLPLTSDADASKWEGQLDRLRLDVRNWTGNSLQIVDLSAYEWVAGRRSSVVFLEEVERDAIELVEARGLMSTASKIGRAR